MVSRDNRPRFPPESRLRGVKNRLLQVLALYAPGQATLRVRLHRWRGVKMGTPVYIGTDVLIETAYPEWVQLGNNVAIGMRTTIIAHFEGDPPSPDQMKARISVRIEDEVFVGPGCIILPHVTLGRGAVVAAGSIVTRSVPPMTMVQGNPARPIAHCEIPLTHDTPLQQFLLRLKPLSGQPTGPAGDD